MRITGVGHLLFALTLIGFGLMSFATHDFAPVWRPIQQHPPARELVMTLSAALSVACGVGLLVRATAAMAARLMLVSVLAFIVFLKAVILIKQPLVPLSWEACGEAFVMLAVAWTLYALLSTDWDKRYLGFAVGENGVRIGRVIYGLLALIPFGVAHFAYLNMTAPLIPAWLPAHTFLAYATGAAYIAAGIAIVSGVLARLAATLVALQIAGFTFLVWGPMIVSGHADAGTVSEACVSWALTTGALVMAEGYRNAPWLSLRPKL